MTLNRTLTLVWPLFAGIVLIAAANGLQMTLLGVRAHIEDFSTFSTGLIMSQYYCGFLFGSFAAKRLIHDVGHIRVFSALAALAAASILLHAVFVNPWAWAAIRALTGFCLCGVYIVIESWLNDVAAAGTRGRILAAYLFTLYGGMLGGQYLLNLAPPEGAELFIASSILFSLALVPVSLSKRPAPAFQSPVALGLRQLCRISPLGVVGVFAMGLAGSTFFSLAPLYAARQDMDAGGVSMFMGAFILGGMAGQMPFGTLSDRIGRRPVMAGVSFAAAGMLVLCLLVQSFSVILYVALFCFGATGLSLYGICTALINDRLKPEQYVAASASRIFINCTGAVVGPVAVSSAMSVFGDIVFFPLLACVFAGIGCYALHRSHVRPSVPTEEQSHFVAVPPAASTIPDQIAFGDESDVSGKSSGSNEGDQEPA